MPTATKKTTTTRRRAAAKPAPVVEPEELEEELEVDDEVEDDAPATKTGGADEVTFGASDLARHLSKGLDKPVTAREIRTLIRKMARDGSGRVQREIIAGNRSRYNWSGVNDPEVKAIIKAFRAGELEADKQEKLQALKDRKLAQKAEKDKATAAAEKKAGKVKAAAVVEEDDEELELDDDE